MSELSLSKLLKVAVYCCLLLLLLSGAAAASAAGDPAGDTVAAPDYLSAEDIKLLADFASPALFSHGEPLDLTALQLSGAATLHQGHALHLWKYGTNEITDPSFEGAGWQLAPGSTAEAGSAWAGQKALKISGMGQSGELARLREPVPFLDDGRNASTRLVGRTRTLSFNYDLAVLQQGTLRVVLTAFDAGQVTIGSGAVELKPGDGWREDGIIYDFPEGTAFYQVAVEADGFVGEAWLDGFKSEHKDYFTPYFDGDSETCLWAEAATPDNFYAEAAPTNKRMMVKGALLLCGGFLALAASLFALIYGHRVQRRRWLLVLLVALPIAMVAAVGLAAPRLPGFWPLKLSLSGSYLAARTPFFYRITAVDAAGQESPASYELKAETGFIDRQVLVSWMRDPAAVKYRLYRGSQTYGQDQVVELDGSKASYVDTGANFSPGLPPAEGRDTGAPHASRSVRPAPDARIDPAIIGLDATASFWIAGELEFGFDSGLPFRPASLFELGSAENVTTLAVSFRFVPSWGDEAAEVLLIKKGASQAEADFVPVPIPRVGIGSKVKYVVAQLYQRSDDRLPAGAYLWYRIDQGPVEQLFIPNTELLDKSPYLTISKRNFYDYFANNSAAISFAVVQGEVKESMVKTIMEAGSLPQAIDSLVRQGSRT